MAEDPSDTHPALAVAPGRGVPVCAVSAKTAQGFEELVRYLGRGQTLVLLGSSGVGKSTIVNRLLGDERLRVGATSDEDGRGRHTTTARQLVNV